MLNSFDAITFLALLAFIIISVEAKPNIEAFFDVCDCNSTDPEGYISNLTCSVGKKRRTFSIELEFKKPFNKFRTNFLFELSLKPKNFVLLNATNLNGCDVLANHNQPPLIQQGVSALKRYSNFPTNCSFKKSVPYYIRGFHVDMNLYPAVTFNTTMNTYFDFVVKKNKIMSVLIQTRTVVKKPKKSLFDV